MLTWGPAWGTASFKPLLRKSFPVLAVEAANIERRTGCEAWGFENMEHASTLARRQVVEAAARFRMWGLRGGAMHVVQADFCACDEVGKVMPRAEVVLVNNEVCVLPWASSSSSFPLHLPILRALSFAHLTDAPPLAASRRNLTTRSRSSSSTSPPPPSSSPSKPLPPPSPSLPTTCTLHLQSSIRAARGGTDGKA